MAAHATILVVDDNAENRALAQAVLEDEGYRVVVATGGVAGIEAFTRDPPDCILLDVRMPDLDGPATCARIRALPGGGDVPILFVTAQRDVDTFDRARLSGGDDYLTKPYRPNELIARIEASLKLRRIAVERSDLYKQLKQQRDDLVRLQLQKEQLHAFLVHDLKNPVSTIGLHAELLLRDRQGSERSHLAGASIRNECRTLLRMIMTILDIAKADAGQLAPARRPVAIAPLVDEVTREFELLARASGVRLGRELSAAEVHADPDLVRRVLENLVENAIRHAPEGTEVVLTARTAARGTELRVKDAGAGVPPEQRERVFERFVQGSGQSTRANRGLGLAFCKVAVEAHGGRIWVEDASPGAAFCLWIAHAD